MNVKLLADNYADTAQINGNPVFSSTYPVRYVKLISRSKSARSASNADQSILVNWAGEIKTINSVVIAGHKITEWGTIRCRLFDGINQDGNTLYDSGVVLATDDRTISNALGWHDTAFWLDAIYQAKSLQIDISDPYVIEGYHTIRRLFIGKALCPAVNLEEGVQLTIQDDTAFGQSIAKTLYSHSRSTYRQLSFTLPHLSDDEMVEWFAELLKVTKKTDVYLSVFPSDDLKAKKASFSFIAKFIDNINFVAAYPNAKVATFSFQEA